MDKSLRLTSEGGYAVVSIEHNGHWVVLMRESLTAPFSHCISPNGIRNVLLGFDCGNVDHIEEWVGE